MTLLELSSPSEVSSFVAANANVVICFSATWCGPCTASKPALIAMAGSTDGVSFGIAYEDKVGNECLKSYSIRAFPTYVLLTDFGKTKSGRVEGADLNKVQAMIDDAGCMKNSGFTGQGNTIGAADTTQSLSKEDQRELRLKRLMANTTTTNNTPQDVEMEDAETPSDDVTKPSEDVTKSTDDAMEPSDDVAAATDDTPMCTVVPDIDPTLSLDKEQVSQLTDGMGFTLIRAHKGLLNGGGSLEGAIEWISNHQDDDNIDDPIPLQSSSNNMMAASYKCNECRKLFSNMAQLELHANQTGHSDFEESTEHVIPLTPEQKAEKMLLIKKLLKAKRAEREDFEKKDNVEREKQRRSMGKEMIKTREQMDRDERKRSAQLRKREKNAEKTERERIRKELAKDKAERIANKGKLMTRLGVEGYNPSAIQYDTGNGDDDNKDDDSSQKEPKKKKSASSSTSIESCISKVSAYRAGGDGGKCLKILNAYITNVVDKEDTKFRTINMKNKVYLAKVKPFIGAKALLLAVGFQPNEQGSSMVLNDDADRGLLETAKTQLAAALTKY